MNKPALPTLHDLIHRHQTDDPDATTIAVFNAASVPQKWRDLFYQVVRDECRRLSRNLVRDMEMIGQSDPDTQGDIADPVSRTAFLQAHFYNGVKYVQWATATVEDHLGRIADQQRRLNGIAADIERHRQAIEQINAAGVTCLAEIDALVTP